MRKFTATIGDTAIMRNVVRALAGSAVALTAVVASTVPAGAVAPPTLFCYMSSPTGDTRCFGSRQDFPDYNLAASMHDGTNSMGSSIALYVHKFRCTDSATDVEGTMRLGPANWANKISSIYTYNFCDVRLYSEPYDDRTPNSGWVHQDSDLGGWSNNSEWLEVS